MKKQILFMMFLSLAFVFAGVNKSYGQTVPISEPTIADGDPVAYVNYLDAAGANVCAPITPLTCFGDVGALNPQVGKTYTYQVEVLPDPEAQTIHWFVTAETDIVTALNNLNQLGVVDAPNGTGNYILNAGAEYNDVANTDNTIDISWKSFDGSTTPVLLVTYVLDAAGCTDNIEVYRIEPVFNFTLDIAGINKTDGNSTDSPTECVSPFESATYDATAEQLNVDYGENWLFFTVTAANFTHSWKPSFTVDYTGSVSDPISVEWAYTSDATANTNWNSTTLNATTSVYESSTAVLHSDTDDGVPTVGIDEGTGECIIVRVRVDHGTNENIVDQTYYITKHTVLDTDYFQAAFFSFSNFFSK
jgi:hypothetical protein